jgi:hypothetical protein
MIAPLLPTTEDRLMQFPQILLFLLIGTLVACGQGPAGQQAATATPAASPTETRAVATATRAEPSATATIPLITMTPVAEATAQQEPTETSPAPTATTAIAVVGRTEEGAYFRGRADAPVTVLDYSDFL